MLTASVTGDKGMHVAILHIPQLFYAASLATVFLAPLLLHTRAMHAAAKSLFGGPLYVQQSCGWRY